MQFFFVDRFDLYGNDSRDGSIERERSSIIIMIGEGRNEISRGRGDHRQDFRHSRMRTFRMTGDRIDEHFIGAVDATGNIGSMCMGLDHITRFFTSDKQLEADNLYIE